MLVSDQPALLNDWLREQSAALTRRDDLISENEIRRQSHEFLSAFADAWRSVDPAELLTAVSVIARGGGRNHREPGGAQGSRMGAGGGSSTSGEAGGS